MEKNICYVCFEKVKKNCVRPGCRCNQPLHQLCFEALLDNKGDVCSVCKGHFMPSQIPIKFSVVFEEENSDVIFEPELTTMTTKRSRKDKNELPEGCVFIDEYVSLVDNYEDEGGNAYEFMYLDNSRGVKFDNFNFTESGRPYCKRKTYEKFCRELKCCNKCNKSKGAT